MTKSLEDILREPSELSGIINRLLANGEEVLAQAAVALNSREPVLIIGIGSSYNASLAVANLFQAEGWLAFAIDASEVLHYMAIPEHLNVILLSRSGKSVEIVLLLEKLRRARANVVAITNTSESPVVDAATAVVQLGAKFDHNVSFTMYSALALAGGMIAAKASGKRVRPLANSLIAGLEDAERRIPSWQDSIGRSHWTQDTSATYFLARGSSVASCHEARLLWEEVAKSPATALTTGGFRHGSQEFVRPGVRMGIWLDPNVLSVEDRSLAAECRSEGACVMCIGADLKDIPADLALEIGVMPPGWEFLIDVLPIQLASEYVARVKNEDPDHFRFCSFVVQTESGLRGKAAS